jgi:hypothetical protein
VYSKRVITHDPKQWAATLIRWMELFMALIVIAATAFAFIRSFGVLKDMDWDNMSTFYELIDRVLIIVIGLEFVRMLIVRNLTSVLELLAFVIARKMLKPDMSSIDIALGSFAFVLLVGARYAIEHYHRRTGTKPLEMKA